MLEGISEDIKGVVYDLDGTIISTENLHVNAWRHAAKKFKVELTIQMLLDQKGISNDEAAAMMLGNLNSSIGKDFIKAKSDYANKHAGTSHMYPEFIKTVNMLEERGIKTWICTSASDEFFNKVISGLPEMAVFKGRAITKEYYNHGKPDPEPLLLTFGRMGLTPSQCIYVGDAYADYLASMNAGCKFIYFAPDVADCRIPTEIKKIKKHSQIMKHI